VRDLLYTQKVEEEHCYFIIALTQPVELTIFSFVLTYSSLRYSIYSIYNLLKIPIEFKILGFHGCGYEELRLVGCYALWLL
jgi:hypothetical protein